MVSDCHCGRELNLGHDLDELTRSEFLNRRPLVGPPLKAR